MLNLTTALYGRLSGSALSAHISNRLYKGQAPEGVEYPYAVFFVVTNSPEKTFSEDYENTIVQFSLFSSASGTTEIENCYTDLKALYDECSMTITDETLIYMTRENALFQVEDHTTPSGTQRVWVYHVEYRVYVKV